MNRGAGWYPARRLATGAFALPVGDFGRINNRPLVSNRMPLGFRMTVARPVSWGGPQVRAGRPSPARSPQNQLPGSCEEPAGGRPPRNLCRYPVAGKPCGIGFPTRPTASAEFPFPGKPCGTGPRGPSHKRGACFRKCQPVVLCAAPHLRGTGRRRSIASPMARSTPPESQNAPCWRFHAPAVSRARGSGETPPSCS